VVSIKIKEKESIDEALKRFKRACERDGLMAEIKKREHFESPGDKRKRKLAQSLRKKRRRGFRPFISRGR